MGLFTNNKVISTVLGDGVDSRVWVVYKRKTRTPRVLLSLVEPWTINLKVKRSKKGE
jgi:hypothetical protein